MPQIGSVSLRYGRSLAFEFRGASLFLRLGRVEVYARRWASYDPRRAVIREPGSVEAYAFGVGVTVSWVPVQATGRPAAA